ncbi:hypothetical protein Fmac_011136 [Flemingia macrophylla]|uniref:Uncharacterized protein n=1 Tax=Flemingia macrophylla TaxID=520843 RepID=A0ABD1MLJ8_9FABA
MQQLALRPLPLMSQHEEHLQRLKETKATSSMSSSSLCHELNGFLDLQDYTDKVFTESEDVTVHSLVTPRDNQSRAVVSNLKAEQSNRVACDSQESLTNEFEKMDTVSHSLLSRKPSSIEWFLSHFENLKMCIQDLDIGL